MSHIKSKWYGQCSYQEALNIQLQKEKQVRSTGLHWVLGFEHPTVVTLGRRGSSAQDIKTRSEDLCAQNIDVVSIWRGGEATLHSPGQLVIYPILDLRRLHLGVKDYMSLLIGTTHEWFKGFGLNTSFSLKNPGLYTNKGKIAFFGIRVNRGVTSHGVSININNDLELFSHIRSCGKDLENFDRLGHYIFDCNERQFFVTWLEIFQGQLSQVCESFQAFMQPSGDKMGL